MAQPGGEPTLMRPCRGRCFTDGQFQQAIGIALESRRLDKLQQAILESDDVNTHLNYALKVAQTVVSSRHYRHEARGTACAPARLLACLPQP